MGTEIHFSKVKRFRRWVMVSFTAKWKYLVPLNCAVKYGQRSTFYMMWLLPQFKKKKKFFLKRASMVVQWLRICLGMPGTQVWSLVWEDPTCHAATKSSHHNYWAHELKLLKPMCLEPVLQKERSQREAHTLQLESSTYSAQLEKIEV